MSRRPLGEIFVSGRPSQSDYQVLTPRTPHSRAGRAEEAFTEVELDELSLDEVNDYQSYRQQQSEPLLASSASSSFPATGYRSKGDDQRRKESSAKHVFQAALTNTPLALGSLLAFILLGAVFISLKQPGTLEKYIGTSFFQPAPPPTPSYVDTVPPPGLLISYENYTKFPLTGDQYLQHCDMMMSGFMHHNGGYWHVPPEGSMDVKHHDDVTDYHLPEGGRSRVCQKTLTYQLDGHVGLVADLTLMAQAAAHAREQNRTFFVDDTYWNRGKWTDHFQGVGARQPGPERGCAAPPPQELVACPRSARHWVVNSRTAKYHFGHSFSEAYEDPYAHEVNRLKPIYARSLQSFIQTIRPNAHNARLIRAARAEVASLLSIPHAASKETSEPEDAEALLTQHNPDPYIAVHIRRGDRHASVFPYRGSYVPIDHYVTATQDVWSRLYSKGLTPKAEATHYPSPPITYVASDSPSAMEEFMNAFSTSTAVFSLESSTDPELRALVSPHEYVQSDFNKTSEEERIRLTRGMIVDFALLGGFWAWEGDVVPGATVCTISSSICKAAAVGLGWDRAFGFGDGSDHTQGKIDNTRKRWVDLDNKGVSAEVVIQEWEKEEREPTHEESNGTSMPSHELHDARWTALGAMGVCDILDAGDHEKGVHIDELSRRTGIKAHKLGGPSLRAGYPLEASYAPSECVARVLRTLCTSHVFREVSYDYFANNAVVKNSSKNESLRAFFVTFLPHIQQIPRGLDGPGQDALQSALDTAFQLGLNTKLHFFNWLEAVKQPDGTTKPKPELALFGLAMMGGGRALEIPLYHDYPWHELGNNTMVDIGGGVGTGMDFGLAGIHPQLKFIIQDRPPVIKQAESFWKRSMPDALKTQRTRLMVHDFFNEQPVKGAEVYHFSSSHDWPDDDCVKILKAIRPALGPNSRFLISDAVMRPTCLSPTSSFPPAPAPLPANYGLGFRLLNLRDLNMLALLNGRERSPEAFRALAKKAGLRVEKFWECRGVVWITEMRKDGN
ncbi:hypothetical protein EUX98_g8050 [Antrodiella citrinella]|uniref:O-methyltransferase C-terminal domain-containing protein n=1 Tax=Antrodiella citrinella TaxID=2447956 RepID=A0A4S4ME25_9APHY|nr:hypothetical protein EUX98_g8050 [Antrodiella citrinella]